MATQSKPERQAVRDTRRLVEAVAAGGDPLALQQQLIQIYRNIDQGITQCRTLDQKADPAQHELLYASVEAYYATLDGLERMDDAVDAEDHAALWSAFAQFEQAVTRIDALVGASGA